MARRGAAALGPGGRALLALLAVALPGAGALAQEVQLAAPRPGTAQPLQLWASHTGTGWAIRVADAAGRERQTFAVESEVAEPAPHLADADGDGAADLWVPVMAGTANLTYAIWTMQPREARFREAGQVSGMVFGRDPGGWLVAIGRDGCCAVTIVFHAFAPREGKLREAFAIERTLDARGVPRRCTPRGRVPQDVLRPWCAQPAPEVLPPGVVPLR